MGFVEFILFQVGLDQGRFLILIIHREIKGLVFKSPVHFKWSAQKNGSNVSEMSPPGWIWDGTKEDIRSILFVSQEAYVPSS